MWVSVPFCSLFRTVYHYSKTLSIYGVISKRLLCSGLLAGYRVSFGWWNVTRHNSRVVCKFEPELFSLTWWLISDQEQQLTTMDVIIPQWMLCDGDEYTLCWWKMMWITIYVGYLVGWNGSYTSRKKLLTSNPHNQNSIRAFPSASLHFLWLLKSLFSSPSICTPLLYFSKLC